MPECYAHCLDLLVSFIKALNCGGIRYCHWKSNSHLAEGLAGLTDLDLLVDRNQSHEFRKLLLQFGFKEMLSSGQKQYPAVEDYLGFDPETGRLAHLHIHYRLILGEQYLKNHRLPLEDFFLNSARPGEFADILVPAPEWELLVLAIRALLKIRDRDLLRISLGRSPISKGIQAEFEYLATRINEDTFQSTLKAAGGFIPGETVENFLSLCRTGKFRLLALLRLRRRMRNGLLPFQRFSRLHAAGRYFASMFKFHWSLGTHLRKRMASGGFTLAFIGADGSGKTTILSQVYSWLNWKLDVSKFYMGSKQPSRGTRILGLLARASGILLTSLASSNRSAGIAKSIASALQGFFKSAYAVATGFDRLKRWQSGYRVANQGHLALFDRFPLPELYKYMDGPQLSLAAGSRQNSWARRERRFYQSISRPDYIIFLHISQDVALLRKPDHLPQTLMYKTAGLQAIQGQFNSNCFHVDADGSLDQTLLQVKRILWDIL